MNFSNENHFLKTLEDLQKRHPFSFKENQELDIIKTAPILSLSYTDEGGFNIKDGDFSKDGSVGTYKVKVNYIHPDYSNPIIAGFLPNEELN
ncbi:hypothetical protein [Leeuwenhoekiella sp. NPDC079379]|uniref:hypothetical protein n=1 Tax=Leeuwenhoekiella sp. NPDC079379 TaxID=3364122 RepID=UPI0037C8577C